MTNRRPYFAHCAGYKASETPVSGMSLPMQSPNGREVADHNTIGHCAVVLRNARVDSADKGTLVSAEVSGNSIFRYPSPSRWSGYVPSRPPAIFRQVYVAYARTTAESDRPVQFGLQPLTAVALSPRKNMPVRRGKNRCRNSRLWSLPSSQPAGSRPVETHHLSKDCLAQAPVQVLHSSQVAAPQPAQSLVAQPTSRTAKPILVNANNHLIAASVRPHRHETIGASCAGGFFVAQVRENARHKDQEGTCYV